MYKHYLMFPSFYKILPILVFLFLFVSPLSVSVTVAGVLPPPSPPSVEAKGYLLMDFHSGAILAERNADERVAPASLTKMMTSYVVFSELRAGNLTLDEDVLVSEKAWRMPGSRTFVEVNTRVPVEVLLKGVIIQSGNDASVALAEHVAGDELVFAQRMNQEAQRLGLNDSHFINSTGLPDPEHYTTARDMATLGIALIRDFPTLYKLHAIKSYEYNNIQQFSRNKLLWRDETVDGIKTGYTEDAGYCLITSARRNNMRLLSAVMGASSVKSRTRSTEALLRYGFRFFETRRLYAGGEPLTVVPVWKGKRDKLEVGIAEDLYVTVPSRQQDSLNADMELNTRIVAPVTMGDVYGRMRIVLDDKVLVERPIIALDSVPEGGFMRQTVDTIRLYFD